jgi:hypothetical protein
MSNGWVSINKELTYGHGIPIAKVKTFLILIALISFGFSFAQSPDTVTEKDYYDFFNSTENPFPVTHMGLGCQPDTNIKTCDLNSYPEFNALHDDTTELFQDTLFTAADKAYIHRQMLRNLKFRWKQGEIKSVTVIDGDRVKHIFDSAGSDNAWQAYYKTFKIGYDQFSVPLFSCNKKRCIVYRGYECSAVYGLGNTNVFERRGDKWVIIKSCSPWIH